MGSIDHDLDYPRGATEPPCAVKPGSTIFIVELALTDGVPASLPSAGLASRSEREEHAQDGRRRAHGKFGLFEAPYPESPSPSSSPCPMHY